MHAATTRRIDRAGDLWTLDAAARELGTTYWHIHGLVKRNHIPTYALGNVRLVKIADLRAYL